jgi:cardiolipin synthase
MADASVDGPLPTPFAPGQTPRERAEAGAERARLTFRRLSGLDRSGPSPPETRADQPWHVWTIPNAIGFVRLALLPAFLRSAWSGDGLGRRPARLFAIIAWSDYADGIAARITGQYSRLGALLDPLVDRLLIISGVVVCWRFELLPRGLLAVLVGREALMLVLGQLWLRRGGSLRVNWPGRLAVWPVMSAVFFGLCGLRTFATVLLAIGVALALLATALYVRAGLREPSTSA